MNKSSDTGIEKFKAFLEGKTGDRIFSHASGHPSQPTEFCPCDRPPLSTLWFYLKAAALVTVLKLPFNGPKIGLLRKFGAQVGKNVFISADVWIDPAFPQLLTIEDNVMVGVGAKIAMHEFGQDRFRAGRVLIRSGAIIGGFSIIGLGVEIGEGATVAGGAVVGRDVPPKMLAIGNPARVVAYNPLPHFS